MILPNVRASFGRPEAEFLISVAGAEGERRLRERGIDSLLDDTALVRALLRRGGVETAPAPLVFYLLVRHALLEREIMDRQLADYTAAVLLQFGRLGHASQGEELPTSLYLADILTELERARGEREFELRAHLGNLALWLGGIFPDHIAHRVQRRGAPPAADAAPARISAGEAASSQLTTPYWESNSHCQTVIVASTGVPQASSIETCRTRRAACSSWTRASETSSSSPASLAATLERSLMTFRRSARSVRRS